ncbi:hypothetical protein [Oscillibacter sp.]|uniref:hypothetical protein n=1 Tax=Oscillibacter sp. TaxID=1945593 RepID=UPI0028AB6031|nr:hypothetical protein [Oscillibacter sp.]
MFLWHSGKKKTPPKSDEFWLSKGNFRDYEAMPGFVGYYGIPSFFYEEPVLEQTENGEKFYRVARSTIKRLLEGSPSVILIKDLSHGGANLWIDKIPEIREMAFSEGGKLLEVHDARCKQYLFVFDVLTDSFFEMIYQLINQDCRYQNIYITYLALANGIQKDADIASIKEAALLNLHIDDDHPIFIIQAVPEYPLEKISEALSTACQSEGWTFRTLCCGESQRGGHGCETGNH